MNSTPSSTTSEQLNGAGQVLGGELLAFITFDLLFGAVIIVANGFLFITIYRDPCRCLRTPSVFLIANLSAADFFMGIVSCLRAAELIYLYGGFGDVVIVNITEYFIGAVSILVAVSTLMAMSYDRYIAVIKPFQYPQRINNRRAKVAIAIIWVNALVLCVLPIADVKRENFLLAYSYSHFVIPSFILTAAYVKIYKMVARQRQELKDVRASLTAVNRRKQLERENRMAITFVLILFIFYCSFLPYFIHVHILYFCSCRTSYAYNVYYLVANEFLSVSCMVDPFMYALRLPRFKRSLRVCFQWWRHRDSVAPWNGTSVDQTLATNQ